MPQSYKDLKWAGGIISNKMDKGDFNHRTTRAAKLSSDGNERNERLRVLDTHGASILKVAEMALEALNSRENASNMRHVVKNCQMRLGVLMDEANAAARALIAADEA
jgi:hypothetical protein